MKLIVDPHEYCVVKILDSSPIFISDLTHEFLNEPSSFLSLIKKDNGSDDKGGLSSILCLRTAFDREIGANNKIGVETKRCYAEEENWRMLKVATSKVGMPADFPAIQDLLLKHHIALFVVSTGGGSNHYIFVKMGALHMTIHALRTAGHSIEEQVTNETVEE